MQHTEMIIKFIKANNIQQKYIYTLEYKKKNI